MVNSSDFIETLWQKGNELFRPMPWRDDTRPYYVLVSELMLQQTQVDRVIPKFNDFITRFPDVASLATAPLSDVLTLWNGLGYNRRAKFLHEAARKIVADFDGEFPTNRQDLLSLPGVGEGTSGAIMVYAFNQPEIFIETNVRTVYFHHFFESRDDVTDVEIKDIVKQTIDHETPREFYWAIMDYGTWLKKNGMGRLSQSASYKKQSPLKGSRREMRGWLLRQLSVGQTVKSELDDEYGSDERYEPALTALMAEGMVTVTNGAVHLTK